MLKYNEETKELTVTEENEYIYDMDEEEPRRNFFKKVSLADTDRFTHYDTIIIDDLDEYLRQFEEPIEEPIEEEIVEETPAPPKKLTDM